MMDLSTRKKFVLALFSIVFFTCLPVFRSDEYSINVRCAVGLSDGTMIQESKTVEDRFSKFNSDVDALGESVDFLLSNDKSQVPVRITVGVNRSNSINYYVAHAFLENSQIFEDAEDDSEEKVSAFEKLKPLRLISAPKTKTGSICNLTATIAEFKNLKINLVQLAYRSLSRQY